MSIVNQSYDRYSELRSQRNFSNLPPSNVIKRSFNSKKLSRQYPLLAASHRAADGALVGLLITVVAMSAIALHAQHLWNVSFTRLEASRNLIQKLRESTSTLESHFLTSSSLSKFKVEPANPEEDLLYVKKPIEGSYLIRRNDNQINFIERLVYYPIGYGY